MSNNSLKIHIEGSSNPEGDPNCNHKDKKGNSQVIYNDDTMGGCGSGWDQVCKLCGKIWK